MSLDLLFQIANAAVMPFWLLLVLAPRSRWTWRLVHSGAPMLAMAGLYLALLVMSLMSPVPGGGFDSLEGVMTLFSDGTAVLLGWVHYLAFDLFIGAWIARDAQRHLVPHGLVIPCLFFSLMLGPVGLLLWWVLRRHHTGTWKLAVARPG